MAQRACNLFLTTNEMTRKNLSMHSGCHVGGWVHDFTTRGLVFGKFTSQNTDESNIEASLSMVFYAMGYKFF